jgi:hypothetical protein
MSLSGATGDFGAARWGNPVNSLAKWCPVRWTTDMSAEVAGVVSVLGIEPGHLVWEMGVDDDCDDELRSGLASVEGLEVINEDEDPDDVVDVVLLWWRDDDGDLVDALVDAIGPLADHGVVWLLTPKPGRDGHVEAEDIADAAPTAGLQQTSTVSAGRDWQGTRLVAPRARK